jgi:cyclophilin family peptidyl-prolyl cis-trans isomerase
VAQTGDAAAAKAKFDPLFAEWKQLLASMREMRSRFQIAKPADREAIKKQFDDLLKQTSEQEQPLLEAAEAYYLSAPEDSGEAGRLLAAMAQDHTVHDDYEVGGRLCNELIDNKFPEAGLLTLAGICEAATGQYDQADAHFKAAEEAGKMTDQARAIWEELPALRESAAKEQKFLERDAAADDLPRVLLKTNVGDITLELFENDAPNTVANFISLVEKGYYDGLSFHRVLGGFMAQGGCPKGDGTAGPGYTIDCECVLPEHRDHFRGSLSMAHAGRNTGGSQFFLCFRPTSHLNGKHTVFGRIVDGMDVLAKLKRREPNSPDKADTIIKATVIRKRDHEYKPKTSVGG